MSTNVLGTQAFAAAAPAAAPAAAAPDYGALYPAGNVKVERRGAKLGVQVPGGLAALGGAAILAFSLLSKGAPGAILSRLNTTPLLLGGLLVGAGAAAVLGAELIPPASKRALATNIPTEAIAREVQRSFTQNTEIIKDEGGRFALVERPVEYRSPGGGGYRPPRDNYPNPYYPSDPYHPRPSYPDPYYPSNPGGGYTSPGDDYGSSPSYPTPSGGSTSPGDDGGSSYNPPSYDPPSYDPPSNDYGGNSSSNGNPSDDDF